MEKIHLAVNGTLMRGLALNKNLLDVNAVFMREARTSDRYRMWSINDQYPAMQRDLDGGNNIAVEIWEMTPQALVEILENEPPGLCLGKIELDDEGWVLGVLGEAYICEGEKEITSWGGWRNYTAQ